MKVSTTFYGKETAIVNLRRRERNQSLGLLVHDFDFIESEWIFQELQLYVNKVRLLSLKSDLDLFSNKKLCKNVQTLKANFQSVVSIFCRIKSLSK